MKEKGRGNERVGDWRERESAGERGSAGVREREKYMFFFYNVEKTSKPNNFSENWVIIIRPIILTSYVFLGECNENKCTDKASIHLKKPNNNIYS